MSLKIDIQVHISGGYTMCSIAEWDDVTKTETGQRDVQREEENWVLVDCCLQC